jgi:hypothetical protein
MDVRLQSMRDVISACIQIDALAIDIVCMETVLLYLKDLTPTLNHRTMIRLIEQEILTAKKGLDHDC